VATDISFVLFIVIAFLISKVQQIMLQRGVSAASLQFDTLLQFTSKASSVTQSESISTNSKLCIACSARPSALGHKTCCRACAVGASCTCGASAARTYSAEDLYADEGYDDLSKSIAQAEAEMWRTLRTIPDAKNAMATQERADTVEAIANQKALLTHHKAMLARQKAQACAESQATAPGPKNAAEARMALHSKQKAAAAEALAKEKARLAHEKALLAKREVRTFQEVQARAGSAAEARMAHNLKERTAAAEASASEATYICENGTKKDYGLGAGGGNGMKSSARGAIAAQIAQDSGSDDPVAGMVGALIHDQVIETENAHLRKWRHFTMVTYVHISLFAFIAILTCITVTVRMASLYLVYFFIGPRLP
jgi:hypothetical protein